MRRSLLSILGAVVLVAGCSQSDAGITTDVNSKLIADDMVKARELNVDTKDKVVTLSGTVESPAQETRAIEIARNTNGVSDVVNNISIASHGEPGSAPTSGGLGDRTPTTSMGAATSDAGITTEVKAEFLADRDLAGAAIDVETRDRVVTLSGAVHTAAEKARAIQLANKVDNVARVEDKLIVQALPK